MIISKLLIKLIKIIAALVAFIASYAQIDQWYKENNGQSLWEVIQVKFNIEQRAEEKASFEDSEYGYLSTRVLSDSDMIGKSKEEMRYMRNAIYASHGRIFNSHDLDSYFRQFSWYKPTTNKVEELLSPLEKSNIHTIQLYEQRLKTSNIMEVDTDSKQSERKY